MRTTKLQRGRWLREGGRIVLDGVGSAVLPELELEGLSFESNAAAGCGTYQPNEVALSRTQKGHLSADVSVANGRLVIADFGVGARGMKSAAKQEGVLREWLARVENDPAYQLKIWGYSDCIGNERNNTSLRKGRAESVFALLGSKARTRVVARGAAAAGSYLAGNDSVAGRARNRAVLVEFQRNLDLEPLDIPVASCAVRSMKIWLNAFIPRDVGGLTRAVPQLPGVSDPSLAGQTMFVTNALCGLTDQRSFSAHINASSRLHSEVSVDLVQPRILGQRHVVGDTVRVGCVFGNIECRGKASKGGTLKFTYLGVASSGEIMVHLNGSHGPGCGGVLGAIGKHVVDATIDYEGTIFIKRVSLDTVDVTFKGSWDQFPAYELVAVLNGSNPVHLGGILPAAGSSPITHLGSKRKVHFARRLKLSCKNGKEVAVLEQKLIR